MDSHNAIRKLLDLVEGVGCYIAVLILGLHPANERRRYIVTTSLTGWAQT